MWKLRAVINYDKLLTLGTVSQVAGKGGPPLADPC